MAEHATQAVIGWGSVLSRGNADGPPETFTEISEVTAFSPPDEQADVHEVSHFQSPNRTKEKIAGMIDAGECSFTINYNPAVYPSHQQVVADKASGVISNWKFTFPDGMETDDFPAFVSGFTPKLGPNDVLTADVKLTVAGSNVRTLPEIT